MKKVEFLKDNCLICQTINISKIVKSSFSWQKSVENFDILNYFLRKQLNYWNICATSLIENHQFKKSIELFRPLCDVINGPTCSHHLNVDCENGVGSGWIRVHECGSSRSIVPTFVHKLFTFSSVVDRMHCDVWKKDLRQLSYKKPICLNTNFLYCNKCSRKCYYVCLHGSVFKPFLSHGLLTDLWQHSWRYLLKYISKWQLEIPLVSLRLNTIVVWFEER